MNDEKTVERLLALKEVKDSQQKMLLIATEGLTVLRAEEDYVHWLRRLIELPRLTNFSTTQVIVSDFRAVPRLDS